MLHTKRFNNEQDLHLFLAGALGLRSWTQRDTFPIVGSKLILTKPNVEVTFTASSQDVPPNHITLRDLIVQVEDQTHGKLKVVQFSNHFYLMSTLGDGLAMATAVSGDAVARRALGITAEAFSTSAIAPINAGRAPRLVDIEASSSDIRIFWEDSLEGSLGASSETLYLEDPTSLPQPLVLSKPSRRLYVGGTGDVVVHLFRNEPAVYTTYVGVPAGTYMNVMIDEISDKTTATNLVVEH